MMMTHSQCIPFSRRCTFSPIGGAAPPARAPSPRSSSRLMPSSPGRQAASRSGSAAPYRAGRESEELPKVIERTDIGAFDRHHLEREKHGRDRVGTTIEPDHDELAALAQG